MKRLLRGLRRNKSKGNDDAVTGDPSKLTGTVKGFTSN